LPPFRWSPSSSDHGPVLSVVFLHGPLIQEPIIGVRFGTQRLSFGDVVLRHVTGTLLFHHFLDGFEVTTRRVYLLRCREVEEPVENLHTLVRAVFVFLLLSHKGSVDCHLVRRNVVLPSCSQESLWLREGGYRRIRCGDRNDRGSRLDGRGRYRVADIRRRVHPDGWFLRC
jgi:hypothetical protein